MMRRIRKKKNIKDALIPYKELICLGKLYLLLTQ